MDTIPKIRKKVNAFLVGEEGKISKQSILKGGVILCSLALSAAMSMKSASAEYIHGNSIGAQKIGSGVKGIHTHHASHVSGTATGTATGTGTGY